MAKTKYSQVAAQPRTAPSGARPGTSRRSVFLLLAALAAVIIGVATLTKPGMAAISAVHAFLEFYAGVFTLVALSLTVMGGLLSTDRIILMIRHRVLLQAVHRAMATTAMVFLAIHISMKVLEAHASLLDVLVPFMASHQVMYVGFGTTASYLMILVAWTGIIRGRFAGSAHPWVWRALHSAAYLAWPVALAHGLGAGRSAKTWVLVSYALCLILVGVALVVRLSVTWGRRLAGPKAQTTGTIRPVGKMGPTPAAVSIALTAPDVPEPVSAAPVTAIPAIPVTAIPAVGDRPAGPDRPARHRVSASAAVPPSSRRDLADPELDEPTYYAEPVDDRRRPVLDSPVEDDRPEYFEPPVRARRRAVEDNDEPVRSGWRAGPDRPVQDRAVQDDVDEPAFASSEPVRARRRAAEEPLADEEEPAYYGEPTYREPTYAETRYGTGSRRPRRLSEEVDPVDEPAFRDPPSRSRRMVDDEPAAPVTAVPVTRSPRRAPAPEQAAPKRRRASAARSGRPVDAFAELADPPAKGKKGLENISDEDFWAHMRGEAVQ